MSLIFVLAVGVLLAGSVAVGIAVARALDELQGLRTELQRARAVRPLVAEVATGAHRLRLAVARMQRR